MAPPASSQVPRIADEISGRGSGTTWDIPASSEPDALEAVPRPLIGLAHVPAHHLGRLVPRVLLNAVARHVGSRGVAGAQRMPREALGHRVGLGLALTAGEGPRPARAP